MKSPLFRGAALWDLLGSWYHQSKDKATFKKRVRSVDNLSTKTQNPIDRLNDDGDEA